MPLIEEERQPSKAKTELVANMKDTQHDFDRLWLVATPSNQAEGLNKALAFYRFILAVILVGLYFGNYPWKIAGSLLPQLYATTSVTYLAFNTLNLLVSYRRGFSFTARSLMITTLIDITTIVLIAHASGGIESGLANLLAITVATASIFFVGTIANLIAALATVALIFENFYLSLHDPNVTKNFLGVGLLGILFFATSLVVQNLAQRIRSSDLIAERSAANAADLQNLNNLIIQRLRTGILVINEHKRIRMMNQSAAQFLGLDVNEGDLAVFPPLPPLLAQRLAQWKQTPHLRLAPIKISDLTPEVQASFTPLMRSADASEDTLIFLEDTRQITQKAQQLKLASLGQFTASIAHEIRNPLGAISHAAQLLNESDALTVPDKKLGEIIQKHATRVNQIIENILQISRREATKAVRIHLNEWIENFVDEFRSGTHADSTIQWRVDGDVYGPFDPSQLHQVLVNLCTNGLRYSAKNTGKASLSIQCRINEKNELPIIEIIDDGLGVPEDQRARLFEPFYTTNNEGTGLGLYISRELCEANQGRLEYIPTPEGKSCFRITLSHPDKQLDSIANNSTAQIKEHKVSSHESS